MRRSTFAQAGRAPVPEWEEVARAAWPGRVPPGIAHVAARGFLPAFALGLILQGIGIATGWFWLGVLGWLLGALSDWLATRADPPLARLLDLVGLRPATRGLLRSVLNLALIATTAPEGLVGFLIALVAVQAAWLAQPVLATWAARKAPILRFVPGATRQPAPFRAYARSYARAVGTPASVVLLEGAALLGAMSGWLPVVGLGVVAAALGWLAHTVVEAKRLPGEGDLVAQLGDPSFLVYVSLAARQSKYIVNQWVPAFDAVLQDGVILVREASQLADLAPTRHPVVYAPTARDVERLLLPSLKAAFYLAYGERNGQLQRHPGLRHILLMHGDSDKATSANNLAKGADEVWVAGPAAIERFAAGGVVLPRERFAVIGRPQVAELSMGPTGNPTPVVLYAPTFEGYYDQTAYSSLDVMGVALVRALVAHRPEVQVWFRPHPASGVHRPAMLVAIAEIEAELRNAGGGHLVTGDVGLSLTECLTAADVLISDISSVATDFLATGRPVITCDPVGLNPVEFTAAFPSTASSYVLEPGLEGLDEVLAAALGSDPLREKRERMRIHILGDTPDGPQAAFAHEVARVTS